ncbi:MAG: ATP-binding protein, partial [Xanthomonadales bacterium]|nr:ATP-binding protein [Xanthomonadales bacterium]
AKCSGCRLPEPDIVPRIPMPVSSRHLLSWAHSRAQIYLATAAVLLLLLLFLQKSQISVPQSWVIIVESIGLALIFVVAAIAFVFHRSFKANSLLSVAMACLGAGLIDLFHMVYHVIGHDTQTQSGPFQAPEYWSSVAAHLYFAVMLLVGWRAAEGRLRVVDRDAIRTRAVPLGGMLFFLLLLGSVFLVYLAPGWHALAGLVSWLAAATAALYLTILVIFLAQGDWKHYPFPHGVIPALILLTGSAFCLVTISSLSMELAAFASDVLRVTAYGLIFTALISGTSSLFSQASSIQLDRRVSELMERANRDSEISAADVARSNGRRTVNNAGTFELDFGSGRLQVNEAVLSLFGAGAELGNVGRLMKLMHPEDRPKVMAAFERSRKEGVLFKQQYRLLLEGEYCWVESVAGVESVDGVPVRLLGYLDEITERVEAARALEESMEAQRQSNKDLQMFAHTVSHDLQEPLRMVSSFMNLLQRRYAGSLNEEAQEFIHFAVEGSERMGRLLDGLLYYSRVQSGAVTFAETSLELPLQDALTNLSLLLRDSATEIDIGTLPTLPCDAGQMMQLFQNLVSNAIKFRGPEDPLIRIRSRRLEERWVVDVTDNGIGIEPIHFERIFQVFQRLNGREISGTGIGLSVCNRIMERHGGRIEVSSQMGRGSTFSLYF